MEIGSFIEMEFKDTGEYHFGSDVIRLNTGRAGIAHAIRILGCDTAWLPYYQCETVRDFLVQRGIQVKYYHIDKQYNPVGLSPAKNEAVIIVNYFGVMSTRRLASLAGRYEKVIVDHAQAFFAEPIINGLSVYSARKFIGVPDGAYVCGEKVNAIHDYEQDYSSDTALFLLQRIEYGCEGKAYLSREKNEERIENAGILKMSELSRRILCSVDYGRNIEIRRKNFDTACRCFGSINKINPLMYYDETCVPMVYPLVAEAEGLLDFLLKNKVFQGRWWRYILDELGEDCFEYYLSENLIPITIDQRYTERELEHTYNLVKGYLEG